MPDFFLDEFLNSSQGFSVYKEKGAQSGPAPSGSSNLSVEQVFKTITAFANEDMVKKTNAVFAFEVKGEGEGSWYLDLKNGAGSAGKGAPSTPADATFIMDGKDFVKMFKGIKVDCLFYVKKWCHTSLFIAGQLKATAAFMTGKLKIRGDMGKAMKLEKLMGAMQSKL